MQKTPERSAVQAHECPAEDPGGGAGRLKERLRHEPPDPGRRWFRQDDHRGPGTPGGL